MEAALLQLDQILHANELSISLVAAVPAITISWALLRAAFRCLPGPRPTHTHAHAHHAPCPT